MATLLKNQGIKKQAPAPAQAPELELELEPMDNIEPDKNVPTQKKESFFKKPLFNKKISLKPAPSATKPKTLEKGFMTSINDFFLNISTVPLKEKLFFAENLRVMVKAGLSMSEALETLSLQTKNKKLRKVLLEVKKGVVEGNSLGNMMAKYPKIFPEYFVNMIKVGELSGNLEKNLEQLSLQMKKDHEITSKVKGAMIYPMVILGATIGIVILMFVYVIPNVLSIFKELEVDLPLATKILIAISDVIMNYGFFVAIFAILLLAGLIFFSRTAQGKKLIHAMILNLWIIGPIAHKVNLARFARTLSSLLKTDIAVIESFKITATVLGNVHYRAACDRVSEEIAKGVAINQSLKKNPKLFPPLVTQMILVGEKSGTVDTLLNELAEFYEGEVSDITKNLSSIIEPILIVFLGGIVALIAFAVISPIYSLSNAI